MIGKQVNYTDFCPWYLEFLIQVLWGRPFKLLDLLRPLEYLEAICLGWNPTWDTLSLSPYFFFSPKESDTQSHLDLSDILRYSSLGNRSTSKGVINDSCEDMSNLDSQPN